MSNRILLTGAGFSANFGAPSAAEMATIIFNDPEIQKNKEGKQIANLLYGYYQHSLVELFPNDKSTSNHPD